MKAKEYYEKYSKRIKSPREDERNKALNELVHEMMNEAVEIKEKRNVKLDSGFVPILKELNDKWNKLARMDPDLYLKEDGLKTLFLVEFGQPLAKLWK